MWSTSLSVFDRELSLLSSAVQKYALRCDFQKMTHVSLELAYSGHDRSVYDYMSVIMITDKFPMGVEFLHNQQHVLRSWRRLSKQQRHDEITQMCYNLTQCKSDRHCFHLARIAMDMAKRGVEPTDPEQKMAYEVENIILRLCKKTEMPTVSDIPFKDGIERLRSILSADWDEFSSPTNRLLFSMFEKLWVRDTKLSTRLYLYNIIGRRFHKCPSGKMQMSHVNAPNLQKVDLDDFVYDKHTTEGKKRKRGMKHFFESATVILNPSENIENRVESKRKAEKIYMADERKFGTRSASNSAERKRIRSTLNELITLQGKSIKTTMLCQKPVAGKPRALYIETVDDQRYFVKGPFKTSEELDFQLHVDLQKEKYGLFPMNVERIVEQGLYYLCAPLKGPFVNMSSGKEYSDDVIWELVKVMIFRAAFKVSDSSLKNVMIRSCEVDGQVEHTVMSVDEMNAMRPQPRATGLIYDLFQTMPREAFSKQVMQVIHTRRAEFIEEVKRYGISAQHLLNYNVSLDDNP